MNIKSLYPRAIAAMSAIVFCMSTRAQVNVTTSHNSLDRSGWNSKETILTPSNVNARQFGKIFSVSVDDNIFAQPLILSNVSIAGNTKNIALVATVNNTVYCFDADNGNVYWSRNYTPAGLRPVQNTDFLGTCNGRRTNNDFARNVGIVGTPVIDTTTNTLYFVSRASDATTPGVGNFYTYLHGVDITTGNERTGSPVSITGSVPGSGSDAINGQVPFYPQHQNQRLALTLYKGVILIGFSSQCDWIPYHGWIFGYDATTFQQKYIYNTTSKAMGGGIWESGGGIVVDKDGYLYIVTGNGYENPIGYNGNPNDLINRAQSAVKLKVTDNAIVPVDFFTPYNFKTLDEGADLDNGSLASFIIPDTKLYLTGDKSGHLYILNTDSLGGVNIGGTGNKIAQDIALGAGVNLRCHPSYYASSEHEYAYVWSQYSQLKAIPFDRNKKQFDVSNIKSGLINAEPLSANISTSSNGKIDGTGIVWVSAPNSAVSGGTKPQMLIAYDANDITKELYNSNMNLKRDSAGGFMKFALPTVANGKVYLANSSGKVNVYGIIDTTSQQPDCLGSNIVSFNKTGFASSSIDASHLPSNAFDGDTATEWTNMIQSGLSQWIGVNLGMKDSICNITIQWDNNMQSIPAFQLQVSDDSLTWNTVKTFSQSSNYFNSVNIKTAGQYVRLFRNASTIQISIKELTIYGAPIYKCNAPTGVTVNGITNSSAIIRWDDMPGAAGYIVGYKESSATNWNYVSATTDSLYIGGLGCNTYYNYNVRTKCSNVDTSLFSKTGIFNTLECNNCILPTRVQQTDIGNTLLPGQGCFFNPDEYDIRGCGNGIGNANSGDGMHFVYKDFAGFGEVAAKIYYLDSTSTKGKAGITIRETFDADTRFVYIGMSKDKTIEFINKQQTGANNPAVIFTKPNITLPCYLKISKKGNTYEGYISPDNRYWTLVGSSTNNMPDDGVFAGMAVSSLDSSQIFNASFKSFTISTYDTSCGPLPKKVVKKATNVGQVGINGSACYYYYNRYKVQGAGDQVDKGSDAFFYTHRELPGSKTITVKITSIDSITNISKAGIMIRWTTKPYEKNIYVGLSAGKGAFFQYRNVSQGSTTTTYIPGIKAPYFVALTRRQDSVYTGYISSDSVNWQKIGDVIIPPTADKTQAGMAVCSGDTGRLAMGIFDGYLIQNGVTINSLTNKKSNVTSYQFTSGSEYAGDDEDGTLKVYPNPALKDFKVSFTLPTEQDVFLSIIGVGDGRIYYTQRFSRFKGSFYKNFAEGSIPKGSYMVSVKTKDSIMQQILIKE